MARKKSRNICDYMFVVESRGKERLVSLTDLSDKALYRELDASYPFELKDMCESIIEALEWLKEYYCYDAAHYDAVNGALEDVKNQDVLSAILDGRDFIRNFGDMYNIFREVDYSVYQF